MTAMYALLRGAGGLAAAWALAGLVLAAGLQRDVWLRGARAPVALLLSAGNALTVVLRQAEPDAVRLGSGSLLLGSGALLVLKGRGTYRICLGPGNVTQAHLAALRRALGALRH